MFGTFSACHRDPGRMHQDTREWLAECDATYGTRLRAARKAKRLAQADLARLAGCSASLVGSIERGRFACPKYAWAACRIVVEMSPPCVPDCRASVVEKADGWHCYRCGTVTPFDAEPWAPERNPWEDSP